MSHTNASEFKRYRGQAGGEASAMSPTRFAPYREIVGEEPDGLLTVEVLECGHKQRPLEDMIGRTYPTRRRCVACLTDACKALGHPLVNWNPRRERGIGQAIMRCKCGCRNGQEAK